MSIDKENANREPWAVTLQNLLARTVSGIWVKIAIAAFVVELVFLFVGSMIPIPQYLITQISNSNNQLGQTSSSLGLIPLVGYIFANNFKIALLEFVPLLGWFFYGLSMFDTALAIEVIGIMHGGIPGPLITLSLLFEPHTWLELPAYAIATTQSFFLFSTVVRRSWFKFEVARTVLVVGIVTVELLVAATFESSEIYLESYGAVAVLVIPWIFFAGLAILLYLSRRKLLREYRYSTFAQAPAMPGVYQMQASTFQTSHAQFCGTCGAKVEDPDGAVFCHKCGQRLIQPLAGANSSSAVGSTSLPPPPNP